MNIVELCVRGKGSLRLFIGSERVRPTDSQQGTNDKSNGGHLQAEVDQGVQNRHSHHRECKCRKLSLPSPQCADQANTPGNQTYCQRRNTAHDSHLDEEFERCGMCL